MRYRYLKEAHKWFDPKNPRTLDEKLLWLNIYWRHPLKARCADKYAVRSYVEEHGLGHLLKELLGMYANSREIDFSRLPDRFVLKCTHGCGFNVFCTDKSKLDVEETRRKLDAWMKLDISELAGEMHYARIKPRIICENYLGDQSGKLPIDYKVYCFDGKAHCTMVCTDRGREKTKYDFFDREWKNVLPYSRPGVSSNRPIPRPEGYEVMLDAAERLSKPFPFVRVDFYSVGGKAVFGEMTFTPNGCIDTDLTDMAQDIMGQLIRLPKKHPESLPFLTKISDKMEILQNRFLLRLSPLLFMRYRYLKEAHKWFDPKNPRTLDEKLLWLNIYWRHPLKARCADKYAVRSYVEEHGLGHLLKELLGMYANSREIDFSRLPDRFVLKCTHGCGFNVFCTDKSKLDVEETRRKLDAWMKLDISELAGEMHYARIKPRIICEASLEDLPGKPINDYKVYCFNGKAHCTMACTDRNGKGAKYDFYDREWKNKLLYSKSSILANRNIPKPEAYEEIIQAAEVLSKPYPFVRMDFYSIKGKAVFGEMTFTPHGCIDTFMTDLAQEVMGKLLRLPEKRPK
jgi:hypothetical protein